MPDSLTSFGIDPMVLCMCTVIHPLHPFCQLQGDGGARGGQVGRVFHQSCSCACTHNPFRLLEVIESTLNCQSLKCKVIG